MLSRDQQKRLAWDALHWIDRLDRLNRRIPEHLTLVRSLFKNPLENSQELDGFTPIERAFDEAFFDTYLLAIALQHIRADVKKLGSVLSQELRAAIKLFSREFKKAYLNDLRDVFEHSYEYLIGPGKKPQLKANDDFGPKFKLTEQGSGVRAITTFGKTYNVGETIKAAFAMREVLFKVVDAKWEPDLST